MLKPSPVALTPATTRSLQALLAVTLAAFWCQHLLFPGAGNRWALGHVLCTLPFVAAAIACGVRARTGDPDARAWWAMAVGQSIYVAASVYAYFILPAGSVGPSFADFLWLSAYVFVYAAIGWFVSTRISGFHASSWLDGAIGGLGAAALVSALVLNRVLTMTGGDRIVVVTNLAYPVSDLLLVLILILASHVVGFLDRMFAVLVAGLLVFLLADISYLHEVSNGVYVAQDSVIELGWTAGVVLIGWAATLRSGELRLSAGSSQMLFAPVASTALVAGLLVYGQVHRLSTVPVILAVVTLVLAVVRLVMTTHELRKLGHVRSEARTDYLTGLPNRRYLSEQLFAAIAADSGSTSLLVIDLDRFKEINDSLSHGVGDELLRQVASRLAAAVPPPSFLARLGGDEFAVCLPDHRADFASEVAHTLRDKLRDPFELSGIPIVIDASIGVATSPDHGSSEASIMACADIAMYQAKARGSGVAAFRHDEANPSVERLMLMSDLAMAFDRDEFTIHYQPQLDFRTREIFGLEALVRWNHPERGLVPPDRFLPLLLQAGQMARLTEQVLTRAMADVAHLRLRERPMRLSVNVSAVDLVDQRLPRLVSSLLATWDAAGGSLVLEVTEDAVLVDRLRSRAVLDELRSAGALISVDDYGTGQASLAYLRDLPLDEIKLDRSFLQGVPSDLHNAAIVRSTIELAHALNLPVMAEGIEDDATLRWLERLGCDAAQGYLIARPMPFDALEGWLQASMQQVS